MTKYILPLSAALVLAAPILGSWGPRGCGPVGPLTFVRAAQVAPASPTPHSATPKGYRWVKGSRDWILTYDGRQVGTWSSGKYYPYDGSRFLEASRAPVDAPCACNASCVCPGPCGCRDSGRACTEGCRCATPPAAAVPAAQEGKMVQNFGIDREAWKKEPREQRFVEGSDKVPDDAGKLRLTVIGPKAERERVLRDFESHVGLRGMRDKLSITDYEPDHFLVKGKGYVTSGRPTIYLLDVRGTVLHRQDDYRGPDALYQALRKADPKYDPKSDPDLNSSLPSFPRGLGDLAVWARENWLLSVGALVVLALAIKNYKGKR
jgi:hypothetical protein